MKKTLRKAYTHFFSVIGWLFLGLSILSSFTILPVGLVLSFLESRGPISSGDQGLQIPLILFLCLIPGALGTTILLIKRYFQEEPKYPFIRWSSILLIFQITGFILTWILTPKIGNLDQQDFLKENPPNAKVLDNLNKILERKQRKSE